MQFKPFALSAAAVCFVASFSTFADVAHSDKTPPKVVSAAGTFATLDRNGDHRLSRSEAGFDHVLAQTFAEIDTDGDGYVSPAEYAAAENTRNPVSSNVPRQ
ncbi:MAG: hypothetical protein ABW171_14710 [Steroidobacter sp.]